jgi:hypothetical protein
LIGATRRESARRKAHDELQVRSLAKRGEKNERFDLSGWIDRRHPGRTVVLRAALTW